MILISSSSSPAIAPAASRALVAAGLALGLCSGCGSTDPPAPAALTSTGGASATAGGSAGTAAASAAGGASAASATGGASATSATGGTAAATAAGGTAAATAAGGTNAAGGSGAAPSAEPVGYFEVALKGLDLVTGTPAHTAVSGFVYDAVPNDSPVYKWKLASSEGGCHLFTPLLPFCDPECDVTTTTCVEGSAGGECRLNPAAHSVGAVTISGLQTVAGNTEFTMNALSPKFNYLAPGSVELPYPPCAEGDVIRLSAAGADYSAFEISVTGINPLELLGPDPIPIGSGQPLPLQWTPPGAGATSRIVIRVDISHHGGSKGMIECEVGDTGSYDVPASLMTELIDLGYYGFPLVDVTRTAVGSATIEPGLVEFAIRSNVERYLEIPGLTSCHSNNDCTPPETCQFGKVCA